MDQPEFVKEIETRIQKRNITINSVPIPIVKEFKEYCESECGDVYSVGLQQLLKTKKLYENLLPLLSNILIELESIKSSHSSERRKLKTFADET